MSRNSSGTYTLPTGNPVVSGTVIEANWANTTLDDISAALTDSLSRSGKGGMSASLRIIDGSVSVPGWAFANETGSGAYRSAAGDWYLTVLGSNIARLRASGMTVTGDVGATTATISGNATIGGTLSTGALSPASVAVTGNATVGGTLGVTGATTLSSTLTSGTHTIASGNLTFTGTGNRITGDFSNATLSNRVWAQTSTTNGPSVFGVLPNGTSQLAYSLVANNSDPTNASNMSIGVTQTQSLIAAGASGSGTYFPMCFYTSGVERMRINTSGNLGVGTTIPQYKVDIQNNQSTLLNLYNTAATSNNTSEVQISAYSTHWNIISSNASSYKWKTYNTERMTLNSDGYLGINSTSPTAPLDVRTAGASLVNIYNTTATSNDSVAAQIISSNGSYWNYFLHNASSHRWATYNTERMRLDANGNLGVGLSPYYKFEVSGSSRLAIDVANSYTQLRSMNTAGSASADMYYNAVNHLWLNSGAEKMRLDSSGMLCIATTASGSAGSSGLTIGTGNSIWYPYSGYTTWRTTNYQGGLYFANSGGDKMQITADGTVVMYTAAQLIVGQNSSSTPASSTADIIAGGLNMNTTRRTSGAAGSAVWGSDGWFYRSTSSIRYKKDVEDYGRGLNELMQMRPVSFKSKSETDGDKVFAGFIAEEIDALGMDEYVVRDQDGSPDAVAYANMTTILVKAVQELKAELDATKAEVAELKAAAK